MSDRKHNGKLMPPRVITAPEGARFNSAEVNAACNRFLKSRGLATSFKEHMSGEIRVSIAKAKARKAAARKE